MKDKKLLQVVNLSPSESWVERLVEVHPMKQIFWASIIQACVFGFMLLSFLLISVGLKANDFDLDQSFNFKQIEEDRQRIEASGYSWDFNIQEPSHKYFVVINALDVATTVYAIENRNTLMEDNPFLPKDPTLEELLLHKAVVSYGLNHVGLFNNHPDEKWAITTMNVLVTIAVLSNIHMINTND